MIFVCFTFQCIFLTNKIIYLQLSTCSENSRDNAEHYRECVTEEIPLIEQAKSRKYRGVFNVKSREKTRQVQDNWSQQLENQQVRKKRDATRCSEV